MCACRRRQRGGRQHLSAKVAEKAAAEGAQAVIISARIEEELAQLDDGERLEYLETLGLAEPGLNRLIRQGYDLGAYHLFHRRPERGPRLVHKTGTPAPQAAGVIHTDFERGFIRETIGYEDYTGLNGEQRARDAGRLRQEGKDYVVQDGDVMLFRFNV